MSQGIYGSGTKNGVRDNPTSYGSPSAASRQPESCEQASLVEHLKQFCQENPGTAAAWCFGIGFVLGWRLKPW